MSEMTLYQEVIYKSRYSRWIPELNRRETWDETVDRYISFFKERNSKVKGIPWKDLRSAIFNLEVMPSMRALMTAGRALDRDNVAGYNCSYVAIDSPRAFDEAMYILMCGTGVGFSVERQFTQKMPEIAEEFHDTDTVIVVKDSKIGWATAFKELISLLYGGQIPKWDTSKLRPSGAKLKTFGGRSSGPKPLEELFRFCVQTFKKAAGAKLNSEECHDIMCKIGEIVVVGGVRRSACISLSNLSDDRMRMAKHGQWWNTNPQRSLANNSAVYTELPNTGIFMNEWLALYDSKSGERGIVNRHGLKKQVEASGRRDPNYEFGVNPCGEIILRPNQFCNLTEVVLRDGDTVENVVRKTRLATILGTLQSSMVDFRYLRKIWRTNTEEESLLGVSLTGIMDDTVFAGKAKDKGLLPEVLNQLRDISIATNKEFAKKLSTNQAAGITCVKPSGTVSQLVDSASGIHPRFAPYYIRRIRMDKTDPLSQVLIDSNIPCETDEMNQSAYCFSFPMKSPSHAVCVEEVGAIDQLNHWLVYKQHWCEHNPSVTIYVKEDEWMSVGAWVYENFDEVGGLSFLPKTGYTYSQNPYEEITVDEFKKLSKDMPKEISWDLLTQYEADDNTTGSQELACTGGACEL